MNTRNFSRLIAVALALFFTTPSLFANPQTYTPPPAVSTDDASSVDQPTQAPATADPKADDKQLQPAQTPADAPKTDEKPQTSPTPATPGNTTQPAPAAPKFDGAKLYKTVFQNLRDKHITLWDPAVRAKWVKEWENKHDVPGDKAFDTEDSTDKAVLEMIRSLGQRYDYYNPPARNKKEKEQFDATLVGIGAMLKVKGQAEAFYKARKLGKDADPAAIKKLFDDIKKISDTNPIVVEEPVKDGPAEKAGIKAGDLITKVDGVSVNGKTLEDLINTIRGKDATVVKITISRDGKEQTLDITRAKVISKVTKFKDLGNGLSYIKLRDWSSQFTEEEMADALTTAAQGKGFILDLRGNPGGRLQAVEAVGQMILNDGTLLTIKERRGNGMVETRTVLQPEAVISFQKSSLQPGRVNMSTAKREELIVPVDMPIIVLVDEGSASASEILAGLLQANHRAIILGKTTVGKGVGQQLIQLPFDRNQHLTNFEFLPGGVAMDWVGVIPDVEVTNPDEVIIDPTKDLQLETAKKLLQEKITALEARTKKAADTRKTNESDFQKALEKAKKDADKPNTDDDDEE